MRPAGRALIGLWATLVLVVGGIAVTLQILGPPGPAPAQPADRTRPPPPTPHAAAPPVLASRGVVPPDAALLEPAPDYDGRMLPRIAADGRTPATAYATHAGLPAHGPEVAVLLEGIGLSDEYSRSAIDTLPPAISLAISPYATSLDRPGPNPLLDAARAAGHEIWLSLPMEPAGSPNDDEGPQALSTATDLALDAKSLEWSLSRIQGYVGVTNALSGLRGDRFATASAFSMVTRALGQRGLLYVDAGTLPAAPSSAILPASQRRADLTLDDQPDAADIEARLSRLEQIAATRGSALGVAGPLRPVLIERLRAWSRHLADRGIALVPASGLKPQAPLLPTPPATTPPLPNPRTTAASPPG